MRFSREAGKNGGAENVTRSNGQVLDIDKAVERLERITSEHSNLADRLLAIWKEAEERKKRLDK